MFTEEQKVELTEGVAQGRSVQSLIEGMGIGYVEGAKWLRGNFRTEMKAAKAEQIARKEAQ